MSDSRRSSFLPPALTSVVSAVALLAVCAASHAAGLVESREDTPNSIGAGAAQPVGRGATAPLQAPSPSNAPAFSAVVKDAKKIDGLLTLWQKDEKVWIELKPEDFGKPFFLSPKFVSGIGETGLFGGSMEDPRVVEFRRVHNQVQLIARNTDFMAKAGTPEGLAVAAAFSPSLLGSTVVASQPHPERKTVLIDAGPLFVSDMLGVGMQLQRTYRQGYGFDGRNSAITAARGKPDMVALEVLSHYYTGSLSLPQPGSFGGNAPSMPRSVPDPRSLFMTMHYSLSKLPDQPMAPRASDPRVGYFTTTVNNYGDDVTRSPKLRWVNRWRLEKKDPAAELSEPVKPIVYWLDRTIPEKYRGAITAGILEWNKAFERIGFKDAIQVKVQPENADFDTLDADVASVRWMTNSSPQFGAIGPTHVDPRSGEILDADVAIESMSSRAIRALRSQVIASPGADGWAGVLQAGTDGHALGAHAHGGKLCAHADQAGEQLSYALDVLAARGDVDPASAEAQQFVLDYLKDVTMHEVGHTLGLRHNFRASRIYSDKQISDPEFTRTHAFTGSVMEYAPINLARPGEKGGTPFLSTLGPYDYWAIEYAYKPFPADMPPAAQEAELEKIAARNGETELAYGTDEDNFLGIDPDSLHFDLGNDVVAFAKKRIDIAHDLFKRQEARALSPNENYAVLRRSLSYAVRDVGRAAGVLLRQIGGIRTLRDFPGTGRDPLQPVSAGQQRAALEVLARDVLAADSFVVSSTLQRRLAPDFQERSDAALSGDGIVATDFSLTQTVLELQRAVIAQLMSDGVAARLLDSEGKAARKDETFRLTELYARLERDVWGELSAKGGDISSARRELQREHVNRLSRLLLSPGASSRADARSLLRAHAQALLGRIQAAARRKGLSEESRAHLADSADTLSQALGAKLQRSGV